jgi:hypothetical protein
MPKPSSFGPRGAMNTNSDSMPPWTTPSACAAATPLARAAPISVASSNGTVPSRSSRWASVSPRSRSIVMNAALSETS